MTQVPDGWVRMANGLDGLLENGSIVDIRRAAARPEVKTESSRDERLRKLEQAKSEHEHIARMMRSDSPGVAETMPKQATDEIIEHQGKLSGVQMFSQGVIAGAMSFHNGMIRGAALMAKTDNPAELLAELRAQSEIFAKPPAEKGYKLYGGPYDGQYAHVKQKYLIYRSASDDGETHFAYVWDDDRYRWCGDMKLPPVIMCGIIFSGTSPIGAEIGYNPRNKRWFEVVDGQWGRRPDDFMTVIDVK